MVRLVCAAVLGLLVAGAGFGQAVSYQGRLLENGSAVNAVVDVRGRLFDAQTGGAEIDAWIFSGVLVEDGLFEVVFDFDEGSFDGVSERWLEVSARNQQAEFVVLTPRQRVLPVAEAGVARFALDAANAVQADVALQALSGPFEPADTTRRSASGLPPGAVFRVEVDAGGGLERAELVGAIELSRSVTLGGGFPVIGPLLPGEVTFRRTWMTNGGSNWYNAFDTGTLVAADIEVSGSFGSASWLFDGFVSGYELGAADDGGLFESITVVMDVRSFRRRFTATGGGASPREPSLAGGSDGPSFGPGTARFALNGSIPSLSVASALPSESRFVQPGGGVGALEREPVEMTRSVWTINDVFDLVESGGVFTLGLEFEDDGGRSSLVVPPMPGSQAAMSAYRLEIAGDGLPVEVFVMTYGL